MGKTQRIIGIVLVLLALGLAAYAWVVSERMTAEQRKAQAQMQQVVVATVRIAAGTKIAPEMLRLSGFPMRPPGSYSDPAGLLGKQTASDIAAGEPLLQERVEGNARTMPRRLEAGERAVAVRVDEVVAVGNRLSPGDRVDVFVTLRRNGDEIPDSQARRLLDGLRVLAFGGKDLTAPRDGGASLRQASDTPKTAVLAVPLADVEKLALAAESGRLLLALRPPEQPGTPASPATPPASPAALTLQQLVGSPKAAPGVPAAPAGRSAGGGGTTVRVLHGLKEKTVYLKTKVSEAKQ